MKKLMSIVLAIALFISLSGCTKNTELYERLIIKAIGIDRSGGGYSVTVRVADYAEDKEYNLTSGGESVFGAMSDLQLAEGRIPMYSHSHFILLGREVLDNDLQETLDFFIRFYKAHPSVEVFGAQKTAAEILNYQNEDGFIPSDRTIRLSTAKDISGKAVSVSLMELVSGSEGPSSASMIPEMTLTQNGATITGTFLLNNYRYCARLSELETMGLLAARGELKKAVVTAELDTAGLITAEVNSCESKLNASEDHRTWQVDVELNMSLASVGDGDFKIETESFKAMENALAIAMKNYISTAVVSAYSSGCDALELGGKVSRKAPRYWKGNSDNWLSLMSSMEYNINVTVNLDRLGEEGHPKA